MQGLISTAGEMKGLQDGHFQEKSAVQEEVKQYSQTILGKLIQLIWKTRGSSMFEMRAHSKRQQLKRCRPLEKAVESEKKTKVREAK